MKLPLIVAFLFTGFLTLAQERILIAAASDLKFAMDSVIATFGQSHDGQVRITYGSSGKLTEQILNGAPFDLLLSADIAYPEMLRNADHTASDIYRYARGRIVLWSSKLDVTESKMQALIDPSVRKIAIANPRHAPYGKRAVESLEHYKLMNDVSKRLVYGENISQTAQFVTTGAADIAIVALSLALSPNMTKQRGTYYLIPEESHTPLIQGAVVTRHGRDNKLAHTFLTFLKDKKAISIFKHFGFTTP